jgi:hypothetical protein
VELHPTPDIRALVAALGYYPIVVTVSHGGAVIVTGDLAVTCALMSLGCVTLIHLP